MDSATFKKCGYDMIEFSANYMETVHEKTPLPAVTPGYLALLMPTEANQQPSSWADLVKDIEPVVLKGMAHWQHRMFFSYFPSGNSYASIMGDIFSNAVGVNGATWDQSPVCTELEIIIMDWAAKFLGLPKFFYSHFSNPESKGGGVIQTSASDAICLSMIAAREWGVKRFRSKFPNTPRAVIMRQMVGYASNQCHSCVEKASMIGLIRLRQLEPDHTGGIRAETLRAALADDKAQGLIPFYYCAILGSTGICAFDDLMELGPIVEENEMYMHVDGAYAGSSFVCPEMRYLSYGMEYAWSFNTNTNKWMLCNFDASLHWSRDKKILIDSLSGSDQSLYNHPIVDYKYWGLPGTRRFRSFKLWLVIRNYGIVGLQNYCRSHINLCKMFERYCQRDDRFEVVGAVRVGLVCFRLKGTNDLNKRYLEAMEFSRKLHMVPSVFHDKYVIRFAVCAEYLNEEDIKLAWRIVEEYASVTIRLREEELKAKDEGGQLSAMHNLFDHQHEHDVIEQANPDAKMQQEEAAAMADIKNITANRDELKKTDPLFNMVTVVSDSISAGNEEGLNEYDKYILGHPEVLDEKLQDWPSKKNQEKYFMNGHLAFEEGAGGTA